MKICPSCRRTYTDEGLNFCLEDGSVLTFAGGVPAETMIMGDPRPTQPSPGFGSQPGVQSTFDNQPQYSVQPKKSSKTWIWVVGIFAILILLCGGGFVGFLAYVGSQVNTNTADGRTPTPRSTNTPGKTTSPSPGPFETGTVQTVDLSEWVKESSPYGTTEYTGGEFIMGAKQKGFYYVLVAPAEYSTDAATTRVTARNISDAATSMGFGLIFHSDPTPLTKDYAFLIDSKKKRYRVVRHEPEKETPVVAWTNSSLIKDGTGENILEIRDKSGTVELYINGQMATSIKNTAGYKGGVAGLYSGDGVKIGFKKLEISK
ncbi:MAG: hypothetical protein H7070_13055 [Saprospiraceae bacterium]|nr:hypothetical protein [Pyrinomonadaceae bacterium]